MKLLTFSSMNAWEAHYPESVILWLTSASLGLHGAFEVKEFEAVDELCFVCPGGKESSRHCSDASDNPDVQQFRRVHRPASRILGSLGFEWLMRSEIFSQHDFVFLCWTRQKQLSLRCSPPNEQSIIHQSHIFVFGCWPVYQVKVNFLKTNSAHLLQPLTNLPGRDLVHPT